MSLSVASNTAGVSSSRLVAAVGILRNVVFAAFVLKYLRKAQILVAVKGPQGALMHVIKVLLQTISTATRRLVPAANNLVQMEVQKSVRSVQKQIIGAAIDADKGPTYDRLPAKGLDVTAIRAEHNRYMSMGRLGDESWKSGKVSGAVYHGGAEMSNLLTEAYGLWSISNPLHPEVFPAIRKMEAEVVSMVLRMYNAPAEACGSVTSGGTESLLMCVKAYRDLAKAERGITEPEMVIPVTIHAAFDKAAGYFGVKIVHIPVDDRTGMVDVTKVARAINRNTIMLAGSAPNFPHGIIDDIPALAALAKRYGLPMHVDCCLGGFIVPFMAKAGFPLPFDVDFRVDGVTSISVDPHKYGFAPKGSSVILYRERRYRNYQYFVTTEWPGGVYASPSIAGSRPGALIAGCWTAMVHMGEDGYVKTTCEIVGAARKIIRGGKPSIESIEGLRVIGDPRVSVVAFDAEPPLKIFGVADLLSKKGWHLNCLQNPTSVHIACTLLTVKAADQLVEDMRDAVKQLREDPKKGEGELAAIYGTVATVPDRNVLVDVDILRLITAWLNPESLLDRTTLLRCLRASTALLELAAPILWSAGAVLDTRTGIEGRLTGGRCDISLVLGALGKLNKPVKGATADSTDGRMAWRWKIYLGAVKTLRIKSAPKKGRFGRGPPYLTAASITPWIGKVDELILEVIASEVDYDRENWHAWLDARWSANEVPRALTLHRVSWEDKVARRWACHRGVKELSLIHLRGTRLLEEVLAARRGKLDAIRVEWMPRGFLPRQDMLNSQQVMERLKDFRLRHGGGLTIIHLSSEGEMFDIPDGLPVTSLCIGLSRQRFMSFSLAAAADSLRSLTVVEPADVMLSTLEQWIPQMNVLSEVNLQLPYTNHASLLRAMHGVASLRRLTLNLRNLTTEADLTHVAALADTLPALTELGIRGSCVADGSNFDSIVMALPRLATLRIEITGIRGFVSLPLQLRKLSLSGMLLGVDWELVKARGLPFLEYIRLAETAQVDDRFKDMVPRLHDDVLHLIISRLNPESLLDRTTLVRCLRASTFLLELSAPILWSNQVLLDNRIGIQGRSTSGFCDLGTVLKALGVSTEGGGTGGDSQAGVEGHKGTLFLTAGFVAPWLGRVDELIVEVVTAKADRDRGDWKEWLDARWGSSELPTALTILRAEWNDEETKRYTGHKSIVELSVVGIESRLLNEDWQRGRAN
ncbi:hypothetical protein HK101_005156 [Irineochytrium annulatum]|nr:hypothetical protein HK101_005156 [Irineochytrium annulatum]